MIRQLVRTVRRSPGRILTSTLALALAIAAIGVFAIPTVATSSLRDAAERDGVANIILGTTDTGDASTLERIARLDNVDHVEPQIVTEVPSPTIGSATVVGLDLGNQQIDRVDASAGRLPTSANEALVPDGLAPLGSSFDVEAADGQIVELTVVGTGGTSFFDGGDVAFTTLDTAARLAGIDGVNRISIRADRAGADTLRDTADQIREELAIDGVSLTYFPITIPDGIHPVEAEIEQISVLIGLLGIVAGMVGLILLASTTNTLITERTREVAVMRALGATPRAMRRRLRRLAIGIAVAAVLIGVPLGIVISNVIARMVLEEFVGLTPDVAVSVPVALASAAFALVGARLVAARSARRVTGHDLADALRDRHGTPFGRRFSERLTARSTLGSLLARSAFRSGLQRRARSLAIATQIGAAVAALMIVASMATTINDLNAAELDPWQWETTTYVAGPGLDIDANAADDDRDSEPGIEVGGEALDWEVDVYGFEPSTQMVDRSVVAGTWFAGPGDAVVSKGFADQVGIELGDEVEVLLASGTHTYEVTGLHANRGREIYLDRTELATDLGSPDRINRIFSLDPGARFELPGVVGIDRLSSWEDDDSGTTAILLIFGAIGLVVVSVAGLAVMSGLAVNVYERRHELAAMQAIGGRRRDVYRLVTIELAGLTAIGLGLGVAGGFFGGREIARSFERSNAIEIGFTFATGALPAVIAVVTLGSATVALLMVRTVTRRPVARTLRGAA